MKHIWIVFLLLLVSCGKPGSQSTPPVQTATIQVSSVHGLAGFAFYKSETTSNITIPDSFIVSDGSLGVVTQTLKVVYLLTNVTCLYTGSGTQMIFHSCSNASFAGQSVSGAGGVSLTLSGADPNVSLTRLQTTISNK